jgi:uncharacterized protein
MAFATVLHAASHGLIDVFLTLALVPRSVAGLLFGRPGAQHIRGEQLRILLAVAVVVLQIRFVFDLVLPPQSLYSIMSVP